MGKNYRWELALLLISYGLYYLVSRDPHATPISVKVLYYTHRTAQSMARGLGRIGLAAEHAYYTELERTRV